jgi:tetratricopeptide (TPR) repeat protein
LQQYDKAIADLKQAETLMPNYGWIYYTLGAVYEETGDCPQAVAYWQKVLDVPDNRDSHEKAQRQLSIVGPCHN